RFKLTAPNGTWLPTPPHLTRFRIGRVNQADFFAWGQDRILRMAQRKVPAGIAVETECHTVDPGNLDGISFPGAWAGDVRYLGLPSNLNPQVSALAHEWVDEQPKGWRQLAALTRHLRTEFRLDTTARVPDDCSDPLVYFLLESRCGPDYQFASALAILARVLGYQTRLVNGFYVSPDHFDAVTQHTPVVKEDLHFWAE